MSVALRSSRLTLYSVYCFFFLAPPCGCAFASLCPERSQSGRWPIQITAIGSPLKQDLLLQTAACCCDRQEGRIDRYLKSPFWSICWANKNPNNGHHPFGMWGLSLNIFLPRRLPGEFARDADVTHMCPRLPTVYFVKKVDFRTFDAR